MNPMTRKALQKVRLGTHETDIVSIIFHLRQKMRKLSNSVNNDLRKMEGEHAVFVRFSGEEMQAIVEAQNAVRVALTTANTFDPEFETRVLQRVVKWETMEKKELEESKLSPKQRKALQRQGK